MKKNLTELVFILDMSGSMSPLTDDTIGGFNSILKEQANEGGEVLVTTYLFNNTSRMIHDRLPIDETVPLTEKDYQHMSAMITGGIPRASWHFYTISQSHTLLHC